MNIKKTLYVGALVGAIGIGAMLSPVVGLANTDNTTQTPPQFQGKFGYGMKIGQHFDDSMHNVLAETIGLTTDDLYELRTSGKSIEQIANEKGFTTEQLLEVIESANEEQLDRLVEDGVITEEQKAYMMDNMEATITRTEFGPFNGQGKGMRGARFQENPDFQPGQGKGFGGGSRWSNNNN